MPWDGAGLTREKVAHHLGMHHQKLFRGLFAEGTTFTELVNEERRRRLAALPRDVTSDDAAALLGYRCGNNLRYRMKAWAGFTWKERKHHVGI